MSKADRRKKRQRYAKPSAPRMVGANDNIPFANDNTAPVMIRGVRLSDSQALRFMAAEAKVASPDLDQQRDGQRMFRALDSEIDASILERDAKANLEELRSLEALRGLDIGVSEVDGAKGAPRVGRDGLETLLTAGSITRTQYAAGLRFRFDYERIDPERTLTPPTLLRDGKAQNGGGEGYDLKIAESWARVRTIYLMIAGVPLEIAGGKGDEFTRPTMPQLPQDHPAMRSIHALNEIAGKGSSIRNMTSGSRTRARIRDDLEFGLEASAIVYGLE